MIVTRPLPQVKFVKTNLREITLHINQQESLKMAVRTYNYVQLHIDKQNKLLNKSVALRLKLHVLIGKVLKDVTKRDECSSIGKHAVLTRSKFVFPRHSEYIYGCA